MLITGSVAYRKFARPERGIDFNNGRAVGGNGPADERPEVYLLAEPLADEQELGDAGMRRLGDRPLDVKMENRFGSTCALLGQPSPSGIAATGRTIAQRAVADEVDIGVIVIGRPMALEILENSRPIRQKTMRLEVAKRE